MKFNLIIFLTANLFVLNYNVVSQTTNVDMIVYNANVYTVDNHFSKVEAFVVDKGVFVAVGNSEEILKKYSSQNIIDAKECFVYPGFIDGHSHFNGFAENIGRYVDLSGTLSFGEVVDKLKEYSKTHDSEWILGRGWDQNLWKDKAFPNNSELNRLFPDKKILLIRIDGHAVLVNNKVLDLLHFTADTKISGGKIISDDKGHLIGVLLDNAADMAKELVPQMNNKERKNALIEAQNKCFAVGLTSVTDAGLSKDIILFIDSLQKNDVLKIKLNVMLNPDNETLNYFLPQGPVVTDRMTVRSIKLYADGALGSRGAKLIEPYSDDPLNTGLMVADNDYYNNICSKAYNAGYQVCTHAIGDGGVRNMLNVYAQFLKRKNDLRWRIEHSQVVDNKDFKLFNKYSIIPSIQSTHATSDMAWAVDRLGGRRIKNAYAYHKLLIQNGWLINGTDFPVESINPLYTYYAAVARKNLEGKPERGFQPENAISRKDALRSITIWAAKGAFEERNKGSIEIGKDADFVILSDDIMKIGMNLVPNIKVVHTVLSGEVVY